MMAQDQFLMKPISKSSYWTNFTLGKPTASLILATGKMYGSLLLHFTPYEK
jgi:hypothetical protein